MMMISEGMLIGPSDGRDGDLMYLSDIFSDETSYKNIYVSRSVVNFGDIVNYAYHNGFATTLAPSDLHVTICYSKSRIDWYALYPERNEIVIPPQTRTIEAFNGGAVVLKLESPVLAARWQQFLDVGASTSFPTYKPHVTLTYTGIPAGAKPYEGRIVLGPEKWTELNTDWKSGVEEWPTGYKPADPS